MEFTGDPDYSKLRNCAFSPNSPPAVDCDQPTVQYGYSACVWEERFYDHRSTNRSDFIQVIPPRICLRPFGAKQNVGYVLGLYTVAYVFGWNLITATIFFVFCAFIYLACMAWTETQPPPVTQ
ncbi:hypothetical protein CHUAL_012937 [Chamberlinius hualienensis]